MTPLLFSALPKSNAESASPEALTNENASEPTGQVAENTSSSEGKATEKEEPAVQYVEKEVDDYSTKVENQMKQYLVQWIKLLKSFYSFSNSRSRARWSCHSNNSNCAERN